MKMQNRLFKMLEFFEKFFVLLKSENYLEIRRVTSSTGLVN